MNKQTLTIGAVVIAVLALGLIIFKGAKSQGSAGAANSSVQALYTEAQAAKKENDVGKAKELYQEIMTQHPNFEGIESVQKDLEDLNIQAIVTNVQSPQAVSYQVQPGDSLGKLAKKFNTTVELIKKRNNLAADTIRAGQQLSIWTGPFSIYVDKSQNILFLKNNDQVVKVYNVSTGSNNSTPVGTFKITSKLVDPVWFKSGAIIPPESPQNVLGSRWMGFDIPGYGIHGTVEPENIGKQVTAGCVRMRNNEVEELFDLLPLGTTVVIVD